jgi:hypothetical protein
MGRMVEVSDMGWDDRATDIECERRVNRVYSQHHCGVSLQPWLVTAAGEWTTETTQAML